jgi:predicted regulator of Ras-like GTPase activity (Roadblock/LC7/MglB family)
MSHSLHDVLNRLRRDSSARAVFVIDSDGDVVASAARDEAACLDVADLAIAHFGPTEGLARLIGEREFGILVHGRSGEDVHILSLAEDRILVVVFDPSTTSLGLVRATVSACREGLLDAVSRK